MNTDRTNVNIKPNDHILFMYWCLIFQLTQANVMQLLQLLCQFI